MIIYHGTDRDISVIKKDAFVSPQLERAARYARYPRNGPGVEKGYIFRMELPMSSISWDEGEKNCTQGVLNHDVIPSEKAICDHTLDLKAGQTPVHIVSLDGKCVWSNGHAIVWQPVSPQDNR